MSELSEEDHRWAMEVAAVLAGQFDSTADAAPQIYSAVKVAIQMERALGDGRVLAAWLAGREAAAGVVEEFVQGDAPALARDYAIHLVGDIRALAPPEPQ